MNRFRAIAIFTGGLALTTANLQAGPTVAATAGDPYSPIVARNVFGLNPPPQITPARQDSAPPPKITLTGITTIIGPPEALFTVAGGKRDGKQWQDKSYILKQAEEEDGVGVVTIDVRKCVVTFSNHGVRQDIALINGLPVGGKLFAVDAATSPLAGNNPKPGSNPKPSNSKPKPGDYNYVDEKTVTAPLPPNENPASAIDAPSMSYGGGIGGDTPPGHGGY